jgi:hypothetical protein
MFSTKRAIGEGTKNFDLNDDSKNYSPRRTKFRGPYGAKAFVKLVLFKSLRSWPQSKKYAQIG